jgi:hypothetical protein
MVFYASTVLLRDLVRRDDGRPAQLLRDDEAEVRLALML